MPSLINRIPSKTGTFYRKDRAIESYKQGDVIYFKNLNGKISCGKLFGFRRELVDCDSCKVEEFIVNFVRKNDQFLSFLVKDLSGDVNEVFLSDVVFSFSRRDGR